MNLRNVLLLTSVLMIGFCLSLYFQNEESHRSLNWDQYRNLSYQEERSHSLEDLNRKTAPYRLEEFVRSIVEKNQLAGQKTRILEIGVGNGRVLMALKKLFPMVEFYGINKEKTHSFYRRESYILTALKFSLLTKSELENLELPYIVFTDLDFGKPIPYGPDKFDLVYSQATLAHVRYKFELWNEIFRVLKPGGISIHTDVAGLNIYSNGVVLDLHDAFREMKKRGVEVSVLDNPQTILFKKSVDHQWSFPVAPHQPLPSNPENLSEEQRRPDMGYNLQ